MNGRFHNAPTDQVTYQIMVKGSLDAIWAKRFGGLTIVSKDGETTLTGNIVDQAALHGLLMQIRDLGLPLISVRRLESKTKRRFQHE